MTEQSYRHYIDYSERCVLAAIPTLRWSVERVVTSSNAMAKSEFTREFMSLYSSNLRVKLKRDAKSPRTSLVLGAGVFLRPCQVYGSPGGFGILADLNRSIPRNIHNRLLELRISDNFVLDTPLWHILEKEKLMENTVEEFYETVRERLSDDTLGSKISIPTTDNVHEFIYLSWNAYGEK